MKKIEAIVRHHKVDEVKDALADVGILGMTVSGSARLWPAARANRNLPRRRVHRGLCAEGEDRSRRGRRRG